MDDGAEVGNDDVGNRDGGGNNRGAMYFSFLAFLWQVLKT